MQGGGLHIMKFYNKKVRREEGSSSSSDDMVSKRSKQTP